MCCIKKKLNFKKNLIGGLILLFFCSGGSLAYCTEMLPEFKDTKSKVEATLTAYRIMSMKDMVAASEHIMTASAHNKMLKTFELLDQDIRSVCFIDFFNTSIPLVADVKDDAGICALYSPFQDVIMLLQTDNIGGFAKIENFCFLSGNVFRGETVNENSFPESIFPKNIPLTIALMKQYATTEEHFISFSKKAANISKMEVKSEQNLKCVVKNMVVRNRCALSLIQDHQEKAYNALFKIQSTLRAGISKEFNKKVQSGPFHAMVDSYSQLPDKIKSSMSLSHFLATKERILYAFSSKFLPQFIAIFTVSPDNFDGQWTFEWMDITTSKGLYNIWFQDNK